MSTWLNIMATSRDASSRLTALWGLTHHDFQLGVKDPELLKAEDEFICWKQQLRQEHFINRTAATQLAKHASTKADKEEEAASKRSFSDANIGCPGPHPDGCQTAPPGTKMKTKRTATTRRTTNGH